MALMRWSYPSATAWEQHASAAEAKPAERPLQERDSNLSAGGLSRLPSQGFMSQGYLTNSFSKGLSMSEAGKDRKRSSNWINKSNEARLRDLRAKGDRNKRRSRISSSAPRKPNAVVKAHHHIVPRFPKPVQVSWSCTVHRLETFSQCMGLVGYDLVHQVRVMRQKSVVPG